MTDQRELDRMLDDYFVAGANELADRVIDAALDQIDHTRQRRSMRAPWRFPTMTPPFRLAAAAVIGALVLGAAFVFAGGTRPAVVAPTPSPAATTVPVWSVTGRPLTDAGNGSVAIPLKDGRILRAGGDGSLASAEVYDPATGKWTATGSMSFGRRYPIAVRLADGKVLVAGGSDTDHAATEIFDPSTGVWTPTGALSEGRDQGFGILLSDGRVLAAGGVSGDIIGTKSTAELFDPATGSWTPTGGMPASRAGPLGIARLPDGRVLVTGGFTGDSTSAEIYDPATGTWTETAKMSIGRVDEQSAISLRDGRVLVCGGQPTSCDMFDPTAGTFRATGPLRENYTDLLVLNQLADGTVLLVGGGSNRTPATVFATGQLFDTTSNTWTAIETATGETRYVRSANVLPDGSVLIVGSDSTATGGHPSAEVYHPTTGH